MWVHVGPGIRRSLEVVQSFLASRAWLMQTDKQKWR